MKSMTIAGALLATAVGGAAAQTAANGGGDLRAQMIEHVNTVVFERPRGLLEP